MYLAIKSLFFVFLAPTLSNQNRFAHLFLPLQNTDQFRTGLEGTTVDNVDPQTLAMFRSQALQTMGKDEQDRDFGGEVRSLPTSSLTIGLEPLLVGECSAHPSLAGSPAPLLRQVPLESTVYWWHEKYKPRKPKYFNRVHTGVGMRPHSPVSLKPQFEI